MDWRNVPEKVGDETLKKKPQTIAPTQTQGNDFDIRRYSGSPSRSNSEALGKGVRTFLLPLLIQGLDSWIGNYKKRGLENAVTENLLGSVPASRLPSPTDDWGANLAEGAKANLNAAVDALGRNNELEERLKIKLIFGGGW